MGFFGLGKKQKKLGLSFRGGGARCGVYVGVLKALEEEDIKIDYIIGSSWGAVVGGLYSAGTPIDKLYSAMKEFGPDDYFDLWYGIKTLSLASRDKSVAYMHNLIGGMDIKDTKIKLYVQVTNIDTKECEILDSGPLIDSLFASSALPLLFTPVELNGKYYIDGDFSATFAADYLRAKGAEKVIGFVTTKDKGYKSHVNLTARIMEPFEVLMNKIRNMDLKTNPLDLLIDDLKTDIGIMDFKNGADLMGLGYEITKRKMSEIKKVVF